MSFVTIIEQPASKSQRFRYLSEVDGARSVGSIPGVSSTSERRTYPTIRVHGHKGPFLVLLSLLNPDNNLVHPHSITGSDPRYTCRNGVIFVISDEPEVVFKNIGILCVKGKTEVDVQSALKLRKQINVDPFGAGFSHLKDHRRIDFTAVRLCFQVFLPGSDWTPADRQDLGKYSRILDPVVSDVVYDAKKLNDLKIVHITYCAGPSTGGTEMTLLCDKYTGQNPDVVFDDGQGWTQVATAKMHHKQLAIVFLAPPYREERSPDDPNYSKVRVYLQQQQNNERGVLRSQPVTVEYLPNPPKGSPLQYPTQPPPNYAAKLYAKGKGKGKSSTKNSNTCGIPGTSSQVPPFSPYEDNTMSPASYQEPPVVNLEAGLNTSEGPAQHYDIASSYGHFNSSNMNIQGNSFMCNMNTTTTNTQRNNVISKTHAVMNTRMENLKLNPTLPGPSNVAQGTYRFAANFPSGTKIKRSVSEHNSGKADSGELSRKREKVIPSEFEVLGYETSPAYVKSNNPFLAPNGAFATPASACPPSAPDHVYNPTLFNDIMCDPNFGGILDEIVNISNAGQAWYDNIIASTAADHNNLNQNNFDQDTIGYTFNTGYNNVEQNVPINIAQNLPNLLPSNEDYVLNNMDKNLQTNNDGLQHNLVPIDYSHILELSEELKRIEM